MDEFDERILLELQKNARLSVVELADRIGLSSTPTKRRLRLLEERGIIEGYTVRLNRKRLGLGLTVYLMVKVEGHSDKRAALLEKALSALPEIICSHVISGGPDLLVEAALTDLAAYERFLFEKILPIEGMKDVSSLIAIRSWRIDGALDITGALHRATE